VCYITRRASNWKKIEKTCHSSNALLRSTLHLSNNSNSPPSSIGSGTACAIYLRRPQPDALRADLSPQPLRFNRWRRRKRRRRHDLDRALLYRLRIRVGPKSPNLGLGVWWGRLVCFPAAPNVSYCFDRSGRVGNAPGFSRSIVGGLLRRVVFTTVEGAFLRLDSSSFRRLLKYIVAFCLLNTTVN
jgi:hypothetical protein